LLFLNSFLVFSVLFEYDLLGGAEACFFSILFSRNCVRYLKVPLRVVNFATVGELWGPVATSTNAGHYEALFRVDPPTFPCRGTSASNRVAQYSATVASIEDDTRELAETKSATTASKNRIWPCDVFGNHVTADTESFFEVAHLIPNGMDNSVTWLPFVECIVGKGSGDRSIEDKKKILHGTTSKQKTVRPSKQAQSGPALGVSYSTSKRFGIKNMVSNKMRLASQKAFFDLTPAVLIVPIMTLEKAKLWNGEPYDAIVLLRGSGEALDTIASAIQFEKNIEHAETVEPNGECETARLFLMQTVLGMGHSLLSLPFDDSILHENRGKQHKFQDAIKRGWVEKGYPRGSVVTPSRKGCAKHARKISFSAQDDSLGGGHPAPDPLILAMRTAVNWSALYNQRLCAAGEADDEAEEDVLAEEEWLEWRASLNRPPSSLEMLAERLGHPSGNGVSV
jgi:hypothetical protein